MAYSREIWRWQVAEGGGLPGGPPASAAALAAGQTADNPASHDICLQMEDLRPASAAALAAGQTADHPASHEDLQPALMH